jgi:hypothetical protein
MTPPNKILVQLSCQEENEFPYESEGRLPLMEVFFILSFKKRSAFHFDRG